MNAARKIFLLLPALAAAVASAAPDIPPPKKRGETLDLAQRLVHPNKSAPLPAATALKDPFNPPSPPEAEPVAGSTADPFAPPRPANTDPAAPPKPPGDFETLEAIASSLTPNLLIVGGERMLIFGQNRKKAGDQLLVTYKGTPYELTITAIDADGNFTLRLRAAEYQRPVKLSKSNKPSP